MDAESTASGAQTLVLLLGMLVVWPYAWWLFARIFRHRVGMGLFMGHLVAALSAFGLMFVWAILASLWGAVSGALLVAIVVALYVAHRRRPIPPNGKARSTKTSLPTQSAPHARAQDEDASFEALALAEIEFTYYDAQSNKSHRRVTVHTIDDDYFEGFCHKRKALRTFVIGKVAGKVLDVETGELLPPKVWAAGVRADPRNTAIVENRGWNQPGNSEWHAGSYANSSGPEILFTGFKKEDRARLEDAAESAGMVVRKSVTHGLDYLCAGPTAGPAKMAQAEDQGVLIIGVEDFYRICEEGVS